VICDNSHERFVIDLFQTHYMFVCLFVVDKRNGNIKVDSDLCVYPPKLGGIMGGRHLNLEDPSTKIEGKQNWIWFFFFF
jgi:hypothetical protein